MLKCIRPELGEEPEVLLLPSDCYFTVRLHWDREKATPEASLWHLLNSELLIL